MAKENKNVLVIAIAGALSDESKSAIQELIKNDKDAILVDGAEIEQQKAELLSEIEKNQEVINKQNALIEELSAELDGAKQAAEAGYITVKSGKKTYRVLGKKFSYKNKEYTAETLVKNQKLVDELIDLGVGFLIEEKGDKK